MAEPLIFFTIFVIFGCMWLFYIELKEELMAKKKKGGKTKGY